MIELTPHAPAQATNQLLATQLAEIVEPEPRSCWRNSVMAMSAFETRSRPLATAYLRSEAAATDVRYIEGWLLTEDRQFPAEHGWLTYAGAVVDVSSVNEADCYYGVWSYGFSDALRLAGQHGKQPFYMRSKKRKQAMLDRFAELPVDLDVAVAYARIAEALTGIRMIYLDPSPALAFAAHVQRGGKKDR